MLRSDVLIVRIDCRVLELGGNSHGRDSEFLDPALERNGIAGNLFGDDAHKAGILTGRIVHRGFTSEEGL